MRRKRRIHVRTAGYAEVTANLNSESPITLVIKCPCDHPDIVLHLEAYMASHIAEKICSGLFKLRASVQREIDGVENAAKGGA